MSRGLHRPLALAACLLVCLPTPLGVPTLADETEQQRRAFLAAEEALAEGARAEARALIAGLRDYPLYSYLRFAELQADLATAEVDVIAGFLADYPNLPLSEALRRDWLAQLARSGSWPEFLLHYRPGGAVAQECLYRQALLATGKTGPALEGVSELWLAGHSRPQACDPVFDAWRRAGGLSADLVWSRIALAMEADNLRLARYLKRYLPSQERPLFELWIGVVRDPARATDALETAAQHPRGGSVLADGLRRLAREEPRPAADLWAQIRTTNPPQAENGAIEAALGLALARVGEPDAFSHLDQVPARPDNLPFQEQRLRLALQAADWTRVAAWIAAMPEGEIKEERWRYWEGRALETLGDAAGAARAYRRASQVRGFWGFLAADRIGVPYNLTHRPTEAPEALRRLAAEPAVRRIEELKALGREASARQEWAHLLQRLDRRGLGAAAVIASRLSWPDRAIMALARGHSWDDLELRFPIVYADLVRREAEIHDLPQSWIYAVIRQESLFRPGAGSRAGAAGLMQLMPATAKEMARRLGQRPPARSELLEPATNIALGTGYLAQVRRRFDGHPVLATAAYNAGPGRVRAWLPSRPLPADRWIATIPFAETRGYVQRVLASRVIYAARLGLHDGPLHTWLMPIGAEALGAQAASAMVGSG